MMTSDDSSPPPPQGTTFDPLLSPPSESETSPEPETGTSPKSSPPPPFPISSSSSSSPFLDPPSYADVVFSPYSVTNGAVNDRPSRRQFTGVISPRSIRAASSDYLRISVSDPVPESEPVSASTFITYLLTSRARDASSDTHVRRRFRDFVTLSDRLAEAYRGYFVPVRPDKNTVESQVMEKRDFVEQRRRALEDYLWRLAEHPVIGKGDELRAFLQAEGKLPLPTSGDVASRMLDGAATLPKQLFAEGSAVASSIYVVAPADVVQPAKGGRDLLRIFKELKQSVVTDWGGARPPLIEEDRGFLERKEKLQDWELQLTTSSQQAEALVKAQQDMGEVMGDLGMAFVKITKFETEEAVYDSQRIRAADAKCVATAAVKASRVYRELNAQTVKHLDTLHQHLGTMLAVHIAFSDRASALLTAQTLMSDLSSLHSRVDKLEAASSKVFGGDRTRLRKVEELRETIRVTEEAKSCAVREYERIKENNRTELGRLEQERHADYVAMLRGIVMSQAGYFEKIANVWATVAEETTGYARGTD